MNKEDINVENKDKIYLIVDTDLKDSKIKSSSIPFISVLLPVAYFIIKSLLLKLLKFDII